jgi:hypothetical protein
VRLRKRLVSILQRVMLRTGRGPLRPLWRLAHEALARVAALYLRGRDSGAAVYVRASLGMGDPVYGLSDIDLALAVPGGVKRTTSRERLVQRWRRRSGVLRLVSSLMLDVEIYEDLDLHEESAAPVLTHGLDGRATVPVYRARPATAAPPRLQERPGLYGPLCNWRLLVGPERRPQPRDWEPGERPIAAWLELQFWWRQAFRACIDPPGPRKPYLCVKLVAEPARILLWLLHGEKILGRKELLERALRLMPEEEASLRMALAALERLPELSEAPLEDAMASLVRQSSRIAEVLSQDAADAGSTKVRLVRTNGALPLPPGGAAGLRSLVRDGQEPQLLPLTDWRARAMPSPLVPDETFAVLPGDPAEPGTVAAATTVGSSGPYPALRSDGLLVLAARGWWRGRLRAAQCAVSDPVSFALMAGRDVAHFPNASGWSARDSAERAVAEHRGWLEETADGPEQRGEALARLLAATRAAHFWTSIQEGEPALPLTLTDAGQLLAGDRPGARSIAEQACGEYESHRLERGTPSAETVAAMREEVLRLPAYGTRTGA